MKDVQNIVVATDFSPISELALDEALDLAERFQAKITLAHAFEIPVYGFPDGILIAGANVASELEQAAQRNLTQLVESRASRGVTITPVLRMGPAWDEVNAVARDTKASLIVVGTHGRRGLSRALLGSVAERLLRTATLPVLVIHGK
jgi:nucleotide-binding universal stress UspA family protein